MITTGWKIATFSVTFSNDQSPVNAIECSVRLCRVQYKNDRFFFYSWGREESNGLSLRSKISLEEKQPLRALTLRAVKFLEVVEFLSTIPPPNEPSLPKSGRSSTRAASVPYELKIRKISKIFFKQVCLVALSGVLSELTSQQSCRTACQKTTRCSESLTKSEAQRRFSSHFLQFSERLNVFCDWREINSLLLWKYNK